MVCQRTRALFNLFDAEQIHDEYQSLIGWDIARALRAICQGGGDDEEATSSDLHPRNAFLPTKNQIT